MPLKNRQELEEMTRKIYDYIESGGADRAIQLLDQLQVDAMREAENIARARENVIHLGGCLETQHKIVKSIVSALENREKI